MIPYYDYSQIELTFETVDIYYPIVQKVNLIRKCAEKYFKGTLLDLGCGRMPYRKVIESHGKIGKYIGIDIENPHYQDKVKPDFYWNGEQVPLADCTVDTVMLIEVLEHVPEPIKILSEANRVLAVGGIVLVTVPFLWTLHDVPNDEYRYTPFAVKRMFETAGFSILELQSSGSWHASMASALALYIDRGLKGNKKRILYYLLLPLIKYLNYIDRQVDHSIFREGEMITGVWCVGRKISKK